MKIKEKDYWICIKSNGCATDIFGNPSCDLCKEYRKCEVCGGKDTALCDKCVIAGADSET